MTPPRKSFDTKETESNSTTIMADNTAPTPPPPAPSWKSLNRMTIKRGMAGVCGVNDHQFLVIGGSEDFDEDDCHLSSCEYYDSSTGTWTRLRANIPAARSGFGVACSEEYVYVMGGMTDPETYRSDLIAIEYGNDISTLASRSIRSPKKWERFPPMKHERALFGCVMHQNFIYVIGGVDEDKKAMNKVERFNIETKTWQHLPNLPRHRFGCAAGVVGNKIYVVGGEDIDDKEMASTDVFNITEQQWESQNPIDPLVAPAVPNMKEKRGMLSVVAIDRFILAIGGGDENGNLSKTIEVLDTQRNAWSYAPTKMKQGNCYTAVAYLKDTNEIVVAGGANELEANVTNLVDSIKFDHGILPPRFRIKDRVQKIIGDMDHGKDRLGVGTIAKALAETVVFKDLEPPFVLGILGKPGQGKTYFSNLMLEHLINVQKQPVDSLVRNTYAGHIYIVKYNAWSFSKGSIFSSLIYQIFKTLNEQLQFEEEMGDYILEGGEVSTIEVFRDLATGKKELLNKHSQRIREIYGSIKKNGDRASERLLKVMNASYKQDQEELRDLRNKIARFRTKRVQEQARHAMEEVGQLVVHKSLKRALKNSLEEKLIPDDDNTIDELLQNIESTRDYKNLIDEMKKIKWWNYRFRASNIPMLAWICSGFLILLGGVLFLVFNDYTVITMSGLLCFAFPVVGHASVVGKQFDPLIFELETEASKDEDVEVGSFDDAALEELKKNIERTKEIEGRSLALKGCSLRDTIATKIHSKEYESNVGIVHRVQQDLQHLSDTMLNRGDMDIVFPRGDPRIVLLIEDLDRCEPSVVVEVIEALQLLVKTKLFVSMLAIDPRYATLSLEKHYKGVLDPSTSGMDFIEKIIQIPFCLPGVGQDFVDAFVNSQIDVEEPSDKSAERFEVVVDNAHRDSIISVISSISSTAFGFSQESDDEELPPSTYKRKQEDQALPRDKVMFTKEDRAMMTEMLKLFGLGPRSMRRNINIFKVLSVIWKRDSERFPVDYRLKRATLFMMLLSSEESTREVTCTIFEMMNLGMVKYHQVMQDSDGELQNDNNLANLFKTELQKRDTGFSWKNLFSSTSKDDRKGTLVAHVEEYLSEYKWTNIDEWNEIASKFLLARCFSFSPIVSEEINMRLQSMEMNQRTRIQNLEGSPKYVDHSAGMYGQPQVRRTFSNEKENENEISMESELVNVAAGRTHDLRWNSSPQRSNGAQGIEINYSDHSYNGTNGHNGINGHSRSNGHSGVNGQNGMNGQHPGKRASMAERYANLYNRNITK